MALETIPDIPGLPKEPKPKGVTGFPRRFASAHREASSYKVKDKVVSTKVVALDGSGDFDNIQAAIDSLPSGGGVVYIKDGTFSNSSSITFPNDNIALIGSGAATIITTATNNLTLIDSNGKDAIFIERIHIKPTGTDCIAISLNSTSTRCQLLNLWLTNLNVAIKLDNASYNFIDAGLWGASGSNTSGVLLQNNSNYNIITHKTLSLSTDFGIKIINSDYNLITDSIVTGAGVGLSIDAASNNNYVLGAVFVNCTTQISDSSSTTHYNYSFTPTEFVDHAGNVVAKIDTSGNLYIKGRVLKLS